eukprot:SAG31_NODE_34543_length_332_cov_0.377682_1_plen_54_part_10
MIISHMNSKYCDGMASSPTGAGPEPGALPQVTVVLGQETTTLTLPGLIANVRCT